MVPQFCVPNIEPISIKTLSDSDLLREHYKMGPGSGHLLMRGVREWEPVIAIDDIVSAKPHHLKDCAVTVRRADKTELAGTTTLTYCVLC